MEFPAHIRKLQTPEGEQPQVQTVTDHCRNAAKYASEALKAVGLSETAYLAGLMHDCGKFTKTFHDYIWAAYREEPVVRGSVNHTFAGCRLLLEHFHSEDFTDYRDLTAELLAWAVGAHHGLFDCTDESKKSGFQHRCQKKNIGYTEARENFLRLCADWPELEERFGKAHRELLPVYQTLEEAAAGADEPGMRQMMFSIGQLGRLILSAVMEGDRRDTAAFMSGRTNLESIHAGKDFWEPYLRRAEEKLQEFPKETEIQLARSWISDLCRKAAEKPEGVYRLNVPTGAGKTLSSLRYALAHAQKWNKQRIIFVTPLLSILEQNAQVIRNSIQDDAIILEHHSNVVQPEENGEDLDLRELAVESWDAPMIITTLVQLLNTLFLGKTTSVRRYHALCNAVVVMDEVQTVPNHMLSLFNTAVNFLSQVCKTTFLLCSATQPCFDKADFPLRFQRNCDVVPYDSSLWAPFHRTELQESGSMRLNEIPAFAEKVLGESDSLLIICNKKSQSEFLYRQLSTGENDCYHLSSAMCMAHRRDVLSRLNRALTENRKNGRKTVCVSTQVMEAGVDISFGSVIRLAAGMDSVVQSAGRCNRNGENPQAAPVYILQCADEDLRCLREIRNGKTATIALLNQFKRRPELLGGELSSDKAITRYYQELYRSYSDGYQNFTVKEHKPLFELMSYIDLEETDPLFGKYGLNQAFQTAGEQFHVLDNNTEDVVVPYGDGEKLIGELLAKGKYWTPEDLKSWLKKAKPYTVSLYDYQKKTLESGITAACGVLVLQPEYYSRETGLITKPETAFLEV